MAVGRYAGVLLFGLEVHKAEFELKSMRGGQVAKPLECGSKEGLLGLPDQSTWHVMQLAGAEAGKPACMALLSAFEAGRQSRLAMQASSHHKAHAPTKLKLLFKLAAVLCMVLVPAESFRRPLSQVVSVRLLFVDVARLPAS